MTIESLNASFGQSISRAFVSLLRRPEMTQKMRDEDVVVGLFFIGVVLILALYGFVSGLQNRAFKLGRAREPYVIALASNPIGFWTVVTALSVTCGICLAFILHALVHR